MMTTILAIDLAKARSLFCWHDVVKGSQRWRTIPSTPRAFHEALTREHVDRVVIEVCDMAGWIKDLLEGLQVPLQIANGNTQGRGRGIVKRKMDKDADLNLRTLTLSD